SCSQPHCPSFPTRRSSDLGLPIGELVSTVGAIGTIGSLLFGVLLAPSRKGELRGVGLRAVHRAGWWALCWLVGSLVVLFLTLSRSEEHTSELQSRENLVCR